VNTLRHLLLLLLLCQQAPAQVLVHDLTDEGREGCHHLGHQQQHVEQRRQRSDAVLVALATLQS
jgi:hypothetical protein